MGKGKEKNMNASKKIVLGKSIKLDVEDLHVEAIPGGEVQIDVEKLIVTRLLVQADSGGGKSWCMRRIFEQTHPFAQQIIIDPEGEFPSLRERFDYVLAAKQGGDVIATPRYAEAFAHRLLELKVSAIIDLFELRPDERIAYIKQFLTALIDAPKHLWHPVIVGIDEAHVSCPEKGFGEAESTGSVIDLCTRGRKRGYMALLGTQRISSLNKNAAAQLKNKIIGSASLDLDMKRAGDELGFDKDARKELRRLESGNFFAFGPAISQTVAMVNVGKVLTTHPEAGSALSLIVPPAPARIRAVLGKLADLPAEAEAQLKTVEDFKREVTELKKQLTIAKNAQPPAAKPLAPVEIKVPILKESDLKVLKHGNELHTRALAAFEKLGGELAQSSENLKKITAAVLQAANVKIQALPRPPLATVKPRPVIAPRQVQSNGDLSGGKRELMIAISQYPEGVEASTLKVLTGYKSTSVRVYTGALKTEGYATEHGGKLFPTDSGIAAIGDDYEQLPTGTALVERWQQKLTGGEGVIFNVIVNNHPNGVSRELIESETSYKTTSIRVYTGALKCRKCIREDEHGLFHLAKEME